MASLKPHLSEEDETTPTEEAYWECSSGGQLSGDFDVCPTPQEVIEQSHAGLLNTAWIRKPLVDQMMQGMAIEVREVKGVMKLVGTFPDDPKRTVEGAPWNPYGATPMAILSWTTKMGAPSFSLPAGATAMGGACPGATAGQSVVPSKQRRGATKALLPILYGNNDPENRVNLAKSICEFCYAEGGQYSTSSVQYAQLLRLAWAQGAIQQKTASGRSSVFVDVMIQAIEQEDFKLSKEPAQWARNGKVMRFFRLHDSGDFFSTAYFDAWKEITDYFHPTYGGPDGTGHPDPIWFWAPTRMWVSRKFVAHVNQKNTFRGAESNFAIRPSAYHVNEHGPLGENGQGLGPGWAAASVVYSDVLKMEAEGETYDWDCRAYAVEDGPTCRGAEGNPKGAGPGKIGCRNCWMVQDDRVNYTLH